MNALHWYLVLHITGFTMMAGTIVADFAINRRLGKYLIDDKLKAVSMLESSAAFPALIGIGALLLLTTGIGMVVVFHGTVAHMLWFRIKMILVVLVALNGALVLRRQAGRLKILLTQNSNGANGRILALNRNMTVFHVIELLLFLAIFILSVFQF
ncbi:MAG TPA: hypothetical protein VG605_18345 [Puia sp.]|jgi:hypothetical protein|nr:hypothetical protein [Puia sp.]